MTDLPLRATFSRDHPIATGAVRGTLGLPIPLLAERVVLELDENELRFVGRRGSLEAWPRGAIHARIGPFGSTGVELKLRWPEGGRTATLRARNSPDALALAELLAQDTRVAAGTELEADEAVLRLAATLPDKLRRHHADELRAITAVLAPGERPEALAIANFGVALLTDRALCWWDGSRKQSIVISRSAIRYAAAGTDLGDDALLVEHGADEPTRLTVIEPPERAAELAAALPPRDGLDALLAAERDIELLWGLRHDLTEARAHWQEAERGELLARAAVGSKSGALLLSDRRLLWSSRKADAVVVPRRDVAGAEAKRTLGVPRLELALRGGGELRFEAIEPRDRADALRSALLRQPSA